MTEHTPHSNCSQVLHAHVVFDKAAGGYRAQVRCACGMQSRIAKALHKAFADALAESKAMPLRLTRPVGPKPRVQKRRPKKVAAVPNSEPALNLPPPTHAEINAAWLAWWKPIMARVGHESRL